MQGVQIRSLVGELRSHRLWDRHGQKNIHIYNYISTPALQLSHPVSVAVKMHTAVRFGLGRWPHFRTCEHGAQRTRLRKSFWKKKSPFGFCGTVSWPVGMSDTHGFLARQAHVMVLWDSGRWQMMCWPKVMQGTMCRESLCILTSLTRP